MKNLLLTLTFIAAVWSGAAQSRIEEFIVKSTILGADKTCSVYLPAGYDKNEARYPVLYLLHGASDTHKAWIERGNMRLIADELFAEGKAAPMIIVMPDASGEDENNMGRHMGYFNVPGWNYEQFFIEEFIPAVEKQYRIAGDKTHRAVAGLSMGGGGATAYAQRHPETFGSACALSAVMGPWRTRDVSDFTRSVEEASPLKFLGTMTDEKAASLRSVRWWVDCGDDDFLALSNTQFYTLMLQNGIPMQYRVRDGGHTWRYWQSALPDVLTFVSAGFRK